jgi:hypothetical protein
MIKLKFNELDSRSSKINQTIVANSTWEMNDGLPKVNILINPFYGVNLSSTVIGQT